MPMGSVMEHSKKSTSLKSAKAFARASTGEDEESASISWSGSTADEAPKGAATSNGESVALDLAPGFTGEVVVCGRPCHTSIFVATRAIVRFERVGRVGSFKSKMVFCANRKERSKGSVGSKVMTMTRAER